MLRLVLVMLAAATLVTAAGMAVYLYTIGAGVGTLLDIVARSLEAG